MSLAAVYGGRAGDPGEEGHGALGRFFRFVPSVELCYLVAMLQCTLKAWDLGQTKSAYDALNNNHTYAMVFAMLLRCDIRKVLRLGPRMLLGFFSATLTIMVGFVVAFLANIGGTASAPVLAGAYSGSLASVGILMALVGYVVDMPLTTLCVNIMRQLA